jgi:RNA polymerase sigma-70 factor (ECF subfamily)
MRIPVDQRAAVLAVDMQGYSVAETARLLGIAEGTVKSRCSRGRARLATVLRETDSAQRPGSGVRRAVSRACDPSRRA